MKRRDFVTGSSASAIGAALAAMSSELGTPLARAQSTSSGSPLQLGRKSNPEVVRAAYERGARPLGGAPYVYLHYDETLKKFTKATEVEPTLDKGKNWTLNPILYAFNIRTADQASFRRLKNQVQLGFNATAPINQSDLTWVFMNAVDIFLEKDKNRPDKLTKFVQGNDKGAALKANPSVTVANGTVSLQVTAFGQKTEGPWKKFFDVFTKAVSSPIISSASKGFGIPGLATDALKFVDGVIDVYAQQEQLVTLWKTGSLEFTVTKDTPGRFKMKPGLWTTVDADYARESNFLEGHTIDLDLSSFRMIGKDKNPADANYLVMDIRF